MISKDKNLPITDIEDAVDEQPTDLKDEQLEENEEELNYRNYPHLDIF